jgi:hypothetical protein
LVKQGAAPILQAGAPARAGQALTGGTSPHEVQRTQRRDPVLGDAAHIAQVGDAGKVMGEHAAGGAVDLGNAGASPA